MAGAAVLGLIGWYKSRGETWTLEDHVTQDGADLTKYTLRNAFGPWTPQAGDVFTDGSLSDTVVSVESSTVFYGVTGPSGWLDGFATVTRKTQSATPHVVNFRGKAKAIDDASARSTALALNSGNTIAAALSANSDPFVVAGLDYASVVEVSPASNLLEIQTVHWYAPQEVKVLVNVHASNSFVVSHDHSGVGTLAREKIITNTSADITIAPGASIALVRDTQGSNDRWRAARNSPA